MLSRVVPEIGSAKMLPMTNKTDLPYAQGCPALGQLDGVQRDCDLGRWQQSQCCRGSQQYMQAYTCNIHAYMAYICIYMH